MVRGGITLRSLVIQLPVQQPRHQRAVGVGDLLPRVLHGSRSGPVQQVFELVERIRQPLRPPQRGHLVLLVLQQIPRSHLDRKVMR